MAKFWEVPVSWRATVTGFVIIEAATADDAEEVVANMSPDSEYLETQVLHRSTDSDMDTWMVEGEAELMVGRKP